jgi:16S rRNA (guanine527-N7)-methyltransferase
MPERATELRALLAGAAQLGVPLGARQGEQLQRLLDELQQWSGAYNLTALEDRDAMLTLHLLDSLSASPFLQGADIADIGTGAGFPGLPLAIAHPERRFTLIDSTAKKIRFVAHAARNLGLANVQPLQARFEAPPSALHFDTVIARAVAALPELVRDAAALCGPDTRIVAMKGRLPTAELAALPTGWRAEKTAAVKVPGLDAERHVIVLTRAP